MHVVVSFSLYLSIFLSFVDINNFFSFLTHVKAQNWLFFAQASTFSIWSMTIHNFNVNHEKIIMLTFIIFNLLTIFWIVSFLLTVTVNNFICKMDANDKLFQHTGNDGLKSTGTHTTPIMHYVDNLTFNFVPQANQGCLVDVRSAFWNLAQSFGLSIVSFVRADNKQAQMIN